MAWCLRRIATHYDIDSQIFLFIYFLNQTSLIRFLFTAHDISVAIHHYIHVVTFKAFYGYTLLYNKTKLESLQRTENPPPPDGLGTDRAYRLVATTRSRCQYNRKGKFLNQSIPMILLKSCLSIH